MARIRTIEFLPEIFQTSTNAQFLGATLDQIVSEPTTTRIQGFVGSRLGYGVNALDYYVTEPTKTRTDYQLDPSVVFTKPNEYTAQDFITYPGIVDAIDLQNGITENNEALFNSQFYSWDSFTDLDKLVNYNEYYWLPDGPPAVIVSPNLIYSTGEYIVTDYNNAYGINLSTEPLSGPTNPTITLLRGGRYSFMVNQNTQFWIQTEPGTSGYSSTQTNIPTRDVYGVNNNGADVGEVYFEVPLANAQDGFIFPGNNLVDVISQVPFNEINGKVLNSFTYEGENFQGAGQIDGVSITNGLRILFYDTGILDEVGYVSAYYNETNYDVNLTDPALTTPKTITVTESSSVNNAFTVASTSDLIANQTITFSGNIIGGVVQGTVYFVKDIIDSTTFTISEKMEGDVFVLYDETGSMIANINQGQYQQGFETFVKENFYIVQLVGDSDNPTIRLLPNGTIPINQKITATYGTKWINRSFYRTDYGYVNLIPIITANLDVLYYQDGTNSNKVGQIRLVDASADNYIDIEKQILGKKTYVSPNNVTFTNGLKVTFEGNIYPSYYTNNQYYVEGVGTAIELVPVSELQCPEKFARGVYIPWDTTNFDVDNWDINLNVPEDPDYITIARNSINKNAWSRSNRWFHTDVISMTAKYNNNPNIVSIYATLENKAKRPIIEFYPNLKLFDSGYVGKKAVDFFDTRSTDALSQVAGLYNYYPDVEVYTTNSAAIASTTSSPVSVTSLLVGQTYTISSLGTTTQAQWNTIAGTVGVLYLVGNTFVCDSVGVGTGTATLLATSTYITVASSDIKGTFQNGMYLSDYFNILPLNTQLQAINVGPVNTILTVSWPTPQNIDTTISATNFVVGQPYQITSLGTTNWNTVAGTTGVTYSVGDKFTCASVGTGTGKATHLVAIVGSDNTVNAFAVFPGARIVFANDTDEEIRNKIYVVNFANLPSQEIILSPAEDSAPLPGEMVAVNRGYNYQGKSFYYDGIVWLEAQEKITVNQAPLFDIFDKNGISLGDSTVYSSTSFNGCKLFSYAIGSGLDDPILTFPISYSSVNNIGDIQFSVDLNSQTFDYVSSGNSITEKVNTGYVHNYNTYVSYNRLLGWQTAVAPSTQYQVFSFNFDPLNPKTTYLCDIAMLDELAYGESGWPRIQVYFNNEYQNPANYHVTVGSSTTTVELKVLPELVSVVQILLLSDQVSNNAYFTIPINLSNNPLNQDIESANLGDIRQQYLDIFINAPDTKGKIFGINNYRDCGNLVPYGTKIIQNSASLVLPGTFLRKQDNNLVDALLFNSREYVKYKQLLVDTVQNSDYIQHFTPAEILDNAIDQIAASRSEVNAFFWSDMLPSRSPFRSNTYIFNSMLDTTRFPLSQVYNFETANYNSVLVYLSRTVDNVVAQTQLIKDVDYTISTDAPTLVITLDLIPGDLITVKEYNQTYGSYVPNTPSKLGLYKLCIPEVVLDVNYSQPTYFIKGHDGSYTKLYGQYIPEANILVDYRDQALLEFEKRIYNNCKLSTIVPISLYEVLPGFFRNTDYSWSQWVEMYSSSFLNWVGQNRINYKTQYYQRNNDWTYNYTNSTNKLTGTKILQGYWRGVYEYFYDTTTPNETPWEMLGFANEPSWWTTRYGPAPYTNSNTILWQDLENGFIWNNGNSFYDSKFARPGLSKIIPVDSNGDLVSPLYNLISNYNTSTFQKDWVVGDDGPAELSYRRSSSYPFDVIRLFAITKPAELYNLGVDLDNYKYNSEFNQYLVNDRSHLVISDVEIYGNGTAKTSYINWIVDYQKQLGIDATTSITTLLDNLDVRLAYRLAGFSDKTLLNFYVEKSSPNEINSALLIPDESYSVLLYENQPFAKLRFSSVIVQQNNDGSWSVYGNAQNFAYFTILAPSNNTKKKTITVGDLSVKVATDYSENEVSVPYGTKFYSTQELAQFLMSYSAYLMSVGMEFVQNENGVELNWTLMVQEMLYWVQSGWENGSIITLNPAATDLVVDKSGSIVQPLTVHNQNFILNQDLYPINLTDLCINRDENRFHVHKLNQGDSLSYAQFNISNLEHGIVFDNVTLFNDTIYNLITGLKQNRINVRGTKTAEWNGTVNAWGFILNQDNVQEWSKNIKYPKGIIVKYKNKYWTALNTIEPSATFDEQQWKIVNYQDIQKGLLPNAASRAYESTLYYDVDKANLEQDADLLAFSLIGYRPRDYLALADLTDITQINVYKNLIKNKGTKNATYAFKGANLPQGGINYEVYENWAIKVGEYGGVLNENFVEFKVNQNLMTGNPSIVSLTNGNYTTGAMQEVPLYSLYNYGRPITDPNILNTLPAVPTSILYPSAGYVNFNDVRMSSFYYAGLPTAVNNNNVIVPINDFYVRDYFWLANFKEHWNVYVWKPIGQVIQVRPNLNNTTTVTFAEPHNLKQLDSLSIVNFASNVDGYYIVNEIVSITEVIINLALVNVATSSAIQGLGIGMAISSQRVIAPSEINSLDLLESEFTKNTVWVDENYDGNWAVYRKSLNYQYMNKLTKDDSSLFGSSVAYSSNFGYLVADKNVGKVYRYEYDDITGVFNLIQTLEPITSPSVTYGTVIAHHNNIIAISQPMLNSPGSAAAIYLYVKNETVLTNTIISYQTITAPGGVTNWGDSLALSGDTNWLYVSDIDNVKVYVYRKQQFELTAGYFTIGKTYTITSLGNTDFTTIGAEENKVGITFVATGIGSGTGTATQVNYTLATIIDSSATYNSNDSFGYSLSTNYDGSVLVVGVPDVDYSGTINNWGNAVIYQRTVQNFEAVNRGNPGNPQFFQLVWTPTSISKTVSATNATGNLITLNNTTSISVNDPIIFYGSDLMNTLVNGYDVYYVRSISGNDITIKTSRDSTTAVTIATKSLSNVSASVQTDLMYVYVNGTLVSDNNYAVIGSQLVYTSDINVGDILTVSDAQFNAVKTLNSSNNDRTNIQFGYAVDITQQGTEILAGSPYEINTENQEGQVYRFTDIGSKFGIVTGITPCDITSDIVILINGFAVSLLSGSSTQVVADTINAARIPNINAAAINDRLVLQVIDKNLAEINHQLSITVLDDTVPAQLGINIYDKTQVITCPHKEGPTQFGKAIKFNEFDSVVISAPVGTRYEGTEFDFTDDENLHNDTVFDNNSTRFIDQYPNSGAVYMFDLLSDYNGNVDNPGAFVYAQPVNNVNELVVQSPLYGIALDFNENIVMAAAPNYLPNIVSGQVTVFNNTTGIRDWTEYRQPCAIVDINKIQNTQLFSAITNETIVNLDYMDPLQGKLLGVVRENIDYVSKIDPASYNSNLAPLTGLTWGAEHVGEIWFSVDSIRFVDYHQNDVTYNSKYWGTLFPGSDVAVYTWVASNTLPNAYAGPGVPYDINLYTVGSVLNASNVVTPVYYFWVRNSGIVSQKRNKTLSDNVIASYIANPKNSGIAYMAPLLPNTFALYNSAGYFYANDSVFHIGFANGISDDAVHNEYTLIRENFDDDFLPGFPSVAAVTHATDQHGLYPIASSLEPTSLYARMLDSLSGCSLSGQVVPDPFLPLSVQSGILVRPRQSFFFDRLLALKNYLEYANEVLIRYPITELKPDISFLFTHDQYYDTTNYWEYTNWWMTGYNDSTRATMQVPYYADLSELNVSVNTIVKVEQNGKGLFEMYRYDGSTVWTRIGLQNGTIQFKSSLWDYSANKIGYSGDFFDTVPYDSYPSQETRNIVRALNEQIYTGDLLPYRNKSLILLFEFIQSETTESQNFLPWLNKTSLMDVSHTVRELKPYEVFKSNNEVFLEGYINEVKPYHVVVKEFLFKYSGTEVFDGDITDFDLPARWNSSYNTFISPELVYDYPMNEYEFSSDNAIWNTAPYSQWFNNRGLSLTGEDNVFMTRVAAYVDIGDTYILVENASGFPTTGVIRIQEEEISYSYVDRALNLLGDVVRGINKTVITTHLPGTQVYMDLPAIVILSGGHGYIDPPKVEAYIDTTLYPAPQVPAQLQAIMAGDTVLGVQVINKGRGYVVLPEIVIAPAGEISFGPSSINSALHTIEIYAPYLRTGDQVRFVAGDNGITPTKLVSGSWYYVNVLETSPSVIIALYTSYADAVYDTNRVEFVSNEDSDRMLLLAGARATTITSARPIRENIITLKFDRTSYISHVIDWVAGAYYGAYFAGKLYNPNQVASSSYTLENAIPDISTVLASAEGAVFELVDVSTDAAIDWSSFIRYVSSTHVSNNSIVLVPQDGNMLIDLEPNASGTTIGMVKNMPVRFEGQVVGGLVEGTTYYVSQILSETAFTVSSTIDGTEVTLSNATPVTNLMRCYTGETVGTSILTVNYPGILTATQTTAGVNYITVPLSDIGTGGTTGFYTELPVFFTGTTFGGVIENRPYYVTSVVDDQTFTISEQQIPVITTLTGTNSSSDYITVDSTEGFATNNGIIFTGTTFGGISSGKTYYVSEVINDTQMTISESINGPVFNITSTTTGSAVITNQKDTVTLTNASGEMTLNVSLPVSPGQINKQLFTFYQTSGYYPNLIPTDYGNLISSVITATVGTVDRVTLPVGANTSFYYINMPIQLNTNIGGLTTSTTYYLIEFTGRQINETTTVPNTQLNITNTSSVGYVLTCDGTYDNTDSLYVNMPIVFSGVGLGGIIIGKTYYVNSIVNSTEFTVKDLIDPNVAVTNVSSTTKGIYVSDSSIFSINDGVKFSGTIVGGVLNNTTTYYVVNVEPTYIQVSTALNGSVLDPGTATGLFTATKTIVLTTASVTPTTYMVATGEPYIKVSATQGGGAVTLSTSVSSGTSTTFTQYKTGTPEFVVSYILGGYQVVITDAGSGFAINNTITIPGNIIGGTTPTNDLILTVDQISSTGEILNVICDGTIPTRSAQYYLQVRSPNTLAVYKDYALTVPVPITEFMYQGTNDIVFQGFTTATVTNLYNTSDLFKIADTSKFAVNDQIVFSGNVAVVEENVPYYVYQIVSSTTFTVSTEPGNASTLVAISSDQAVNFTVAKAGSFMLLPEPFFFNQSIVKFNNRLYECIISNNDAEFVLGKWQEIRSDDPRLNALDRAVGYYAPTVNMPGLDLTQLFSGTEFPYPTLLGNAFQPDQQYPIDSIIADTPFTSTIVPNYTVRGTAFTYGYGPEEMVPGNVTDDLNMIVNTRPGTNWPVVEYAHVGYEVVSIQISPTGTQTAFSFKNVVQTPAQVTVQSIDTTGLGTSLYLGSDYTVNWVNKTVNLVSPLATGYKLRIDVYEVGNGDQLVKANTDTDPIRINSITSFTEIYVNCAYSASFYQGSGVIRDGTSGEVTTAVATDGFTNRILCDNVKGFTLNKSITFQGIPFGGLLEDTTYYVKTISYATNSITVSLSVSNGIAGPTVDLETATGTMYVNIETGTGLVWTDPIIYHNGDKLILGTTGMVTRTKGPPYNTVTTNTTAGLAANDPIVFCDCIFGGIIVGLQQYYIKSIVDNNEFTISLTPGGDTIVLSDATGGSMFITYDYAFGIQPDGISAKIMFSDSTYTNGTDYLVYSLFGETKPDQYGYTVPEIQLITADGTVGPFDLINFIGGSNPTNAIVEVDGLRLVDTDYTISTISNTITFSIAPTNGSTISVLTYNDTSRQYLTSQYSVTGKVDPIQSVYNVISEPITGKINQTTSGTNVVTMALGDTTTGFTAGQTIIFKTSVTASGLFVIGKQYQIVNVGNTNFVALGAASNTVGVIFTATGTGTLGETGTALATTFGGINLTGTVYFIDTVPSSTTFTIKDYAGSQIVLSNETASLGNDLTIEVGNPPETGSPTTSAGPTVRVTTTVAHGFVDNDQVRIDGVRGSVQLNNNIYYVKYITPYVFDLYQQPYSYIQYAENVPVVLVSAYTGGGYTWLTGSFFLASNEITGTTATTNRISATSVAGLVTGTPIYFNAIYGLYGDALLDGCGLVQGTKYYVKDIFDDDTFTVSETQYGENDLVLLTKTGTIYAIQWEQTDVNRLWVTVNGERVPSTSLRLNPGNEVSILTEIAVTDNVIITSMIPSATPNEQIYMNIVNESNVASVYNCNSHTRTWLTQPIYETDTSIHVYDATRVTDSVVQTVLTPVVDGGYYYIGLNANKRLLSSVTIENLTKGSTIDSSHYEIVLVDIAPQVKISAGSWISVNDTLRITSLEGNTIFINGEQIGFDSIDLTTNTLNGIHRGINGTAAQPVIPKYVDVFGLLESNKLPSVYYNQTWNSYVYNTTYGDPLEISETVPAIFLNTDI